MTAPAAGLPCWLGADLAACVGVHPARPQDPVQLEWLLMVPPLERLRVREWTCQGCAPVSYEFGSIGGAYAIRRTVVQRGRLVVHETPGGPRRQACEWWRTLLEGRAV